MPTIKPTAKEEDMRSYAKHDSPSKKVQMRVIEYFTLISYILILHFKITKNLNLYYPRINHRNNKDRLNSKARLVQNKQPLIF